MPYPTSALELRARWHGIIRVDRKVLAYRRRLLAKLEAAGELPEGVRVEAEGEQSPPSSRLPAGSRSGIMDGMKLGRGRWIALVSAALVALSGCSSDDEFRREDPGGWWRAEIRRFGESMHSDHGGITMWGSIPKADVDILGAIAKEGSDQEKWAVTFHLGSLARQDDAIEAALPILVPLLGCGESRVRGEAGNAMAQIGQISRMCDPYMIAALASPWPDVRYWAAAHLCMFFPPPRPSVRSRIIEVHLTDGGDDTITRCVLEELGAWALPERGRARVGTEGARRETLDHAIRKIRRDAQTGPG